MCFGKTERKKERNYPENDRKKAQEGEKKRINTKWESAKGFGAGFQNETRVYILNLPLLIDSHLPIKVYV